jgi:hypothetical protein
LIQAGQRLSSRELALGLDWPLDRVYAALEALAERLGQERGLRDPSVASRRSRGRLARRRRELARQALGVAARADLAEHAVRLLELSLVPLLIAALARQLGELDVDQRLNRFRTRLARELERARERRLDLRTRGVVGRAEQDARQREARSCLTGDVPLRAGDLEALLY